MNFIRELFQFAVVHKKLWLLPLILMLVALGGLILLAQGSAIAPFIYVVF